jgi:hypothetical protein
VLVILIMVWGRYAASGREREFESRRGAQVFDVVAMPCLPRLQLGNLRLGTRWVHIGESPRPRRPLASLPAGRLRRERLRVLTVSVVVVPPLVRRGLRVTLGRVLPLLLAPERGDVEIAPGGA